MRKSSRVWTRRTRRRGSALAFVLIMTIALAALAMSAIALTSNATLQGKNFDREREYRYAAEAALAIGKSRLNNDPMALKASGDTTLYQDLTLVGADGKPIPGVTVDVYAATTGSTTGQFGRFASVIAVAQDVQHRSRFVRRLELSQESFAKFAYWSDKESNSGNVIYFNNNDQLRGPVWSNDQINIGSGGATFWDEVGTAQTIAGKSNGVFKTAPLENQKPINLPSTANLSYLPGYAASGNLAFNAPNGGSANAVKMRIEFVPVDLDFSGTTTGVDEGFLRVYTADPPTAASYLRGDGTNDNCGDWHGPVGSKHFYPVSVHRMPWFAAHLVAIGDEYFPTLAGATKHGAAAQTSDDAILSRASSRCYLGGDPHLVAVERNSAALYPNALDRQKGGDDTTFTATGTKGKWKAWVGAVDGRLAGRTDAAYLYPLHRSINTGSKGVVYITGTVGLSGVVRGNLTIYANQFVILLDDLKYATPPQTGLCQDMLGIIAGNDIVVADNALNSPQDFSGFRNMDDTKDFNVHAVMMALNQSFTVENYNSGPTNVNGCEGTSVGRGCLYLNGGVIQKARGPVGLSSGAGFTKRYSYDRCAIGHPPPYFPTTGRLIDNRYYEIDPVGLDVHQFFQTITASK